VLPIIIDAWEGCEHNGWGVLPVIEMLKEVEIQWMGSAPHHASHISSKKLLGKWGALPIAFAHVNQKSCSIDGERFPCGTFSNRISAFYKFFSLSATPWFGTN
jgi:hypothetical protein